MMYDIVRYKTYSKYRIFGLQKKLFRFERILSEIQFSYHFDAFEKFEYLCEYYLGVVHKYNNCSVYLRVYHKFKDCEMVLKENIKRLLNEIKLEYFRLQAGTLEEYVDVILTYKSKYVPEHVLIYELYNAAGNFKIDKVMSNTLFYKLYDSSV